VTTENIHPENRDVDTSVVEAILVSETGDNLQEPTTQAASDVTVPAEQETEASSIPETSENPQGSITQAASDVTIPARQETAVSHERKQSHDLETLCRRVARRTS